MSIERRLRKLELSMLADDGPCKYTGVASVVHIADEPFPADAMKCPRCRNYHVIRVIEEIVEACPRC